MKALVLSDLHLEFKPLQVPPLDIDLVILAGDIDKGIRGVTWASETFSVPVLYVPGNHEYYSGHIDYTLEKIRAASANHTNVHVLDQDEMVIGDVRFLGATTWTDYTSTGDLARAMSVARESMNDFRRIRADARYRKLRPDDLVARNRVARAWLSKHLAIPFAGKTVVVSHHCPIPQVAGDESHEGHLGASYFNNWPTLIDQCDFWIFGHTHHPVDRTLGTCRLISNPRGYPGEQTGFDPMKIVEF
ncbi:serine/threonine protein phosphatase [Pseudomonas syringae pv. actinidiae]|uniref:metallophosphoesterase n=1 Tax=Pseudomonas syringae TaxID=317 RepID=UPI000BB54E94|nr:metallophosphoesterase [Pseudomonas syringae]PBK51300.1 serine/threonine protein phosphatase [Pseudomonas syringae pv. actinidiae]PBK51868.1 serine/threonine protein phosphatase [Pseudomonas syringae pv. actinidiae]RJX54349.1 serine/threonine protein phosphatase [Pseudomonas syringae pv. actinidiae]RJX60196.1 serine/threonine protein phosphatase [Pseudomonas syringae pv. actinidiae]RJX60321.1 serine/threonine protein phosphatase [Pseudomonas syringae pv. actinidiae]